MARKLERALRAHRSGDVPGVRAPGFVRTLRSTGRDAADIALATFNDVALDRPLEVLGTARSLWGFTARWRPAPKRTGIEALESDLNEAWRDVNSAIGPGRDPNRLASHMIVAIETFREQRQAILDGVRLQKDIDNESRNAIERLGSVDRLELLQVAHWIMTAAARLAEPETLAALRKMKASRSRNVLGSVEGDVLYEAETGFGRFVIGGFGPNKYDGNQLEVIIDLGGDDEYTGRVGGASESRRMAIVIDIDGDDRYETLNDGLGSATYGLGVLLDMAGDDRYVARSRSAGYGCGGLGLFMDLGGDDVVDVGVHCCGVGLGGTGIFLDVAGEDQHSARSGSFGHGLSGGLGLFVDGSGNDVRKLTAAGDGDGEFAFGFGSGLGLIPGSSGGLGVFCDLSGKDEYEAEGALAFGAAGRDSAGLFYERSGNDTYTSGSHAFGAARDHSVGLCLDVEGKDRTVAGAWSYGFARDASMAGLVDLAGDDVRAANGRGFGIATSQAFAWYVDLAGKDRIVCTVASDASVGGKMRGDALGVYLHLGGAADDYSSFSVDPKPADGETFTVDGGSRGAKQVRLVVDR